MVFLSSSKKKRKEKRKALGSLHHVLFHEVVDVQPDCALLTLAVSRFPSSCQQEKFITRAGNSLCDSGDHIANKWVRF